MVAGQVLITGADGYLGKRLARRYLEATSERVLLWVRARGEQESRAKEERFREILDHFPGRAHLCFGDLSDPDPFAAVDGTRVGSILHAAAVTRFNVDRETADRVNVQGTQKLLDFARRCPALTRLGFLSTLYISGLATGRIAEEPVDERPEFANHYERSKWEAEAAIIRSDTGIPWRIFRVATVIADDESGAVTQQNAFHNTLKLLYYGLISLIPGRADTPVYLVTGQFVTDAVLALMQSPGDGRVFHVAHTREESLTLGEIIDIAFEAFGQDEDFVSRRILKPMFADEESFGLLVEAVHSFGGGVVNQAVSSVAPFARQLFVQKDVENRRLAGAFAGPAPDARELVRRVCTHLVRTRWGREVAGAAR